MMLYDLVQWIVKGAALAILAYIGLQIVRADLDVRRLWRDTISTVTSPVLPQRDQGLIYEDGVPIARVFGTVDFDPKAKTIVFEEWYEIAGSANELANSGRVLEYGRWRFRISRCGSTVEVYGSHPRKSPVMIGVLGQILGDRPAL